MFKGLYTPVKLYVGFNVMSISNKKRTEKVLYLNIHILYIMGKLKRHKSQQKNGRLCQLQTLNGIFSRIPISIQMEGYWFQYSLISIYDHIHLYTKKGISLCQSFDITQSKSRQILFLYKRISICISELKNGSSVAFSEKFNIMYH